MISMNDCLRQAGRVFGLALLFTLAVVAQTPVAAPPPRPNTPSAPGSVTPAPAGGQISVPQAPNHGPSSDGQNDGQFTIHTNVNEVNLIFTVTDKHGRFIQNLQQSDFALLDNQKAPAQVFNFTQQTNLPLRVGIMIDASTSIRSQCFMRA